jgi:hypothetical protein
MWTILSKLQYSEEFLWFKYEKNITKVSSVDSKPVILHNESQVGG